VRKKVKIRKAWVINPKTRIKESKKRYSRIEIKKELKRIVRNEEEYS